MFLRVSILFFENYIGYYSILYYLTVDTLYKKFVIFNTKDFDFGFHKYFDIMSLTAVYCQVDFRCESIPVKLLSTDTKFIVVRVNVRTTIRFFRVFSRQSVTYIHIQTYTLTHENICIQVHAISHCKICYRQALLFVSKAIS